MSSRKAKKDGQEERSGIRNGPVEDSPVKPTAAGAPSKHQQEVYTMTEKMIENRVKKLQAIEAQQKELEAQAEAIRAELKADLEAKGVEELRTPNFILRWKEIISSRLDGKALKAALPDVYGQFCRPSASRRFTIA